MKVICGRNINLYREKLLSVQGRKKTPHQKWVLRHMEVSLSSLGFQLSSTEKERSSLAQGQARTAVALAICSR